MDHVTILWDYSFENIENGDYEKLLPNVFYIFY